MTVTMTVADVANGLVEKCRQGDFMGAVDAYYDDDIVSIEAAATDAMPAEIQGIDNVRGKNEWWTANHEVHGFEVEGPFVGDNAFAVRFTFDVTPKTTTERSVMTEMALYTVEDGKITREQFFYNAG